MKKFILVLTLSLLLAAPCAFATSELAYLQSMPDVPLMSSMQEIPGTDAEHTSAYVSHDAKSVARFYSQKLEAAGWKPRDGSGPDTYVNAAGDTLEIDIAADLQRGGTNVTFTRTPAPKTDDSNSQGN